jgi:hypothetical protein
MTNIEINIERDQELMEILKVNEISYLIAHTDRGELALSLRSGEDDYRFTFNSAPVDDELNDELMKFYE